MTNRKPRFRISTWPGFVVPAPAIRSGESIELLDGWVLYRDNGWPPQEVAPELAIRDLQQVDVLDATAVVEFIRAHGMINRTGESSGLPPGPAFASVPDDAERSARMPVHWTDLSAHLAVAQVLARHVLYHLDGGRPMQAWEEIGFSRTDRRVPNDDDVAWSWFQGFLDKGLRSFHARVDIEWLAVSDEVGRDIVTGLEEVGLFSVLCVQVLNMLTEELPARRCANDACGMWFVRQTGRAEHGQYRTEGVIYCSKSCAKAQSQREWRRRERDKQKGTKR